MHFETTSREKAHFSLEWVRSTEREGTRLRPPEFNLPDLDGVAGGSGRLELEHDEVGGSVGEGEGRVDEAVQRRWGARGPRRGRGEGGGDRTRGI